MQPPISVGQTLQNRYKILRILGQGGFGRTYLAEDTRRFNELCAIKELIPVTTETGAWDKARELFQREAITLYQLQHPQVPQFRERFEEEQRLFLVQDYVPGKTYRALLQERLSQGKTFSEQEVVNLMRLLLSILGYIHDRGIIHRDISPENIILRDRDGLPVLIDFGVVKELATKLQSPSQALHATAVGKLGYAPSEQMQTGRAYSSSDLYSLAVTALVLLTGKEPQDLYDERQAGWNWQRYISLNPRLGQILNRMLSHIPSDRFQTASQVSQALAGLSKVNTTPVPPPPAPTQPNLSNLQTMAVGARPDPNPQKTPAPNSPSGSGPVIPSSSNTSILDNPLAVGAISCTVVILAGFGSWAIVSSIRNNQRFSQEEVVTNTSPQTFPSPVIGESTSPTPTDSPTFIEPIVFGKRLRFDSGGIARQDGQIRANETIQFTFQGEEGQQLTATLADVGTVYFTVLGPNREPVDSIARQVASYQGVLPYTGRYIVQLSPGVGISESQYNLSVSLQQPIDIIPTQEPIEPPLPNEPQATETPVDEEPIQEPDEPLFRPGRPRREAPVPNGSNDRENDREDVIIPTEPNNNRGPINENILPGNRENRENLENRELPPQ